MKWTLLISLLGLLASQKTPGQTVERPVFEISLSDSQAQPSLAPNGIYRTASNYRSHSLSFAFYHKPGCRIEMMPLSKGNFRMITPDTTIVAEANRLWGMRCNGIDWRFFQGEMYTCINWQDIVLYPSKATDYPSDAEIQEPTHFAFYFSRTDSSEIYPLTRKNLRKVYADHAHFLVLLQAVKWHQNLEAPVLMSGKPRVVELLYLSRSGWQP